MRESVREQKLNKENSLVSDGMKSPNENRTREKGNNSILTHMRRILYLQFKSKLFFKPSRLNRERFACQPQAGRGLLKQNNV
jgi:hypothetical protein